MPIMQTAIITLVASVVCLFVTGNLTASYLKKSGFTNEDWESVAGTGVVPSWVSLLSLASWVGVVVGVVLLGMALLG